MCTYTYWTLSGGRGPQTPQQTATSTTPPGSFHSPPSSTPEESKPSSKLGMHLYKKLCNYIVLYL